MVKVTLDTNILSPDFDVRDLVSPGRCQFFIVSVTEREMKHWINGFRPYVPKIVETAVFNESSWDSSVWAGEESGGCLERVLTIISNGSFPPTNKRAGLTQGQRRQLRDAMIFCAHIKKHNHILVTDDKRGFIRHGKRAELEKTFNTRIMTRHEFVYEFGEK